MCDLGDIPAEDESAGVVDIDGDIVDHHSGGGVAPIRIVFVALAACDDIGNVAPPVLRTVLVGDQLQENKRRFRDDVELEVGVEPLPARRLESLRGPSALMRIPSGHRSSCDDAVAERNEIQLDAIGAEELVFGTTSETQPLQRLAQPRELVPRRGRDDCIDIECRPDVAAARDEDFRYGAADEDAAPSGLSDERPEDCQYADTLRW